MARLIRDSIRVSSRVGVGVGGLGVGVWRLEFGLGLSGWGVCGRSSGHAEPENRRTGGRPADSQTEGTIEKLGLGGFGGLRGLLFVQDDVFEEVS